MLNIFLQERINVIGRQHRGRIEDGERVDWDWTRGWWLAENVEREWERRRRRSSSSWTQCRHYNAAPCREIFVRIVTYEWARLLQFACLLCLVSLLCLQVSCLHFWPILLNFGLNVLVLVWGGNYLEGTN